jgi:hypothetical protein
MTPVRKHVWVSISTDLHLDATSDFRDLGCHINIINNCQSLDKETRTFGLSKDFQVIGSDHFILSSNRNANFLEHCAKHIVMIILTN